MHAIPMRLDGRTVGGLNLLYALPTALDRRSTASAGYWPTSPHWGLPKIAVSLAWNDSPRTCSPRSTTVCG